MSAVCIHAKRRVLRIRRVEHKGKSMPGLGMPAPLLKRVLKHSTRGPVNPLENPGDANSLRVVVYICGFPLSPDGDIQCPALARRGGCPHGGPFGEN